MAGNRETTRTGTSQRRMAREVAMKVLYQVDLGGMEPERALAETADAAMLTDDALAFASELVDGALASLAAIDERIGETSRSWSMAQMAAVDRAIMRLAAYEVIYREDIPVSASINEAVELAKKYSTIESGRFVNGVLGALARALRKAQEAPAVADVEPSSEPQPTEQ